MINWGKYPNFSAKEFTMMSAFGPNANEAYVTLLGQWGMLIMSFYFGGRTLEKILAMKDKK